MSTTYRLACAPVITSRKWNQVPLGTSTAPVNPGPL